MAYPKKVHFPLPLSCVHLSIQSKSALGPNYSLTVLGSGAVNYQGISNVTIIGEKRTTVQNNAILAMVEAIMGADYFKMQSLYLTLNKYFLTPDGSIDQAEIANVSYQEIHINVRLGDSHKRIHACCGIPKRLLELIDIIIDNAGAKQWIGKNLI